ncbi:MAG: 50S ribosomal protein L21 [Verrucomicrobiota bacterium JB023]|nr:50S ribosomal protein L21 [Verrucomicrobiota bacterium JB023]
MPYAVIKTGGKQYRVSEGDQISVEKLDVEVGSETSFDNVLLVNDGSSIRIGTPAIDGASVSAKVLEQERGKKEVAFKFRRRKGYHKTKGYRRLTTKIEITGITG